MTCRSAGQRLGLASGWVTSQSRNRGSHLRGAREELTNRDAQCGSGPLPIPAAPPQTSTRRASVVEGGRFRSGSVGYVAIAGRSGPSRERTTTTARPSPRVRASSSRPPARPTWMSRPSGSTEYDTRYISVDTTDVRTRSTRSAGRTTWVRRRPTRSARRTTWVRTRPTRSAGRTTWVRRAPIEVRRPTKRFSRPLERSAAPANAFRRPTPLNGGHRNRLGRRRERLAGAAARIVGLEIVIIGLAMAFARALSPFVRVGTPVPAPRTCVTRWRTRAARLPTHAARLRTQIGGRRT
jgi:hypothetical protein